MEVTGRELRTVVMELNFKEAKEMSNKQKGGF